MKRIIYNLTDEQKAQLIADFTEKLNTETLDSASFRYSAKFDDALENEPKAKLYINALAYAKMMIYIRDTSTEIAWHGTAIRLGEGTTMPLSAQFYVQDVFLYPQIVRDITVDTDQEKYNAWVTKLDDDTFNNMRFQGHSHVNMGVTPSGIDTAYYDSILKTLQIEQPDGFYIFTVMNKSGDMYLIIYDLAKNIVYSKADIDVIITQDGSTDLMQTIKDQKTAFCETPKPTYPKTHTQYNTKQVTFDPEDPANYYDFGKEEKLDYLLSKYAQKEAPSETDELFDDLDRKYKNMHLSANVKQHIKKKKK